MPPVQQQGMNIADLSIAEIDNLISLSELQISDASNRKKMIIAQAAVQSDNQDRTIAKLLKDKEALLARKLELTTVSE